MVSCTATARWDNMLFAHIHIYAVMPITYCAGSHEATWVSRQDWYIQGRQGSGSGTNPVTDAHALGEMYT